MRQTLLICALMALASGTLTAGDFGDAKANYGLVSCYYSNGPRLGTGWSSDAQNPVTPGWSGDTDDGLSGAPTWSAGSATNSLTVQVSANNGASWMLTLWVDANDDGQWAEDERYDYSTVPNTQSGQFTISNIVLESIFFYRNKRDHAAVRILLFDPLWELTEMAPGPAGDFWEGEVEDWLVPLTPVGFSITNNALLPDAEETVNYGRTLTAINGVVPYTWSVVGGALPAGLSLAASGNNAVIAGAPSAGTFTPWGTMHTFTIQCQGASSVVTQRTFSLRVVHAPAALPFSDTFSTDKGWTYGPTWSRDAAAAAGPFGGWYYIGWANYEPGFDHTQNGDNRIIGDAIGAAYDSNIATPRRATSPVIDCSSAASVELVFWRWVGVNYGVVDNIGVQVSADGLSWTDVWINPIGTGTWYGITTVDAGWTRVAYDISAIAANQGRVQVRFFTGQTSAGAGWSGWCVDDVQVRAKPVSSALTVTQLDIQTPYTHATGHPMCYLGSYNWTAQVGNSSAEAITLDDLIVGVFESNSALPQDSWHDVGSWTLTGPTTIAPGASGVQLSGTFQCTDCTGTGALVETTARMFIGGMGQSSGLRHEATTTRILYIWDTPMPGLHVYEYQVAAINEIPNGSAPAGRRDFGAQTAGTAGAWLNIIIKNTDNPALTLGMPALVGPGAADFDLDTSSYVTGLSQNQNTYFSVRFHPSGTGQSNAAITFSHDATNTADPFTFDITGLGVTNSAIAVVTESAPGGVLITNGAAASGGRDFGSVDTNAGPTGWLTICVENQGTTPLTLGTPQLAGASASEFMLDVTGLAASVAPGANTWFAVAFDPAGIGAKSALVQFTHSGAGTASPFEFEVAGTGVLNTPVIVVSEMVAGGPAVAPGSGVGSYRNFGAQDVGAGATGWRYFHIENHGWLDLQVGTPQLTGADAADFNLDLSGFISTVAAQGSTTIAVAFDPAQQGLRSAWVTFTHNDISVVSPFTFEVRGLATDPNGVVISTFSLPGAKRTVPYAQQLNAAQGTQPYTWQLISGSLPAGLTLASDGLLSGTTQANAGLYSFTVSVTDSLGGNAQAGLTLMLSPAPGELGGGGGGGSGGGGCAAGNPAAAWLLLPAIAAFALRRRRTA
jgi:hypothetical protein